MSVMTSPSPTPVPADDAPKRSKKAARSELARVKILQTAIELVAEKGVDRFKLDDVGEKAGHSRALPAKYFRDKAGLLKAVVDHVFRPQNWGQETGLELLEIFVRRSLPEAQVRVIRRMEEFNAERGMTIYASKVD